MMTKLRPQAQWLVREMAAKTGLSEAEAEQGILELIERGHLRVIEGGGPNGCDVFAPIFKSPQGNDHGGDDGAGDGEA